MAKRDFAFGKENFILIAVAVACIVLGFILMSGGGSGDNTFNPDIFSAGGYGYWFRDDDFWNLEE